MAKFGELKSIGHNIADSLASGVGLLIGVYIVDVFDDAARSPNGHITVDFLSGEIIGGFANQNLADAVVRYAAALPDLCRSHGVDVGEFKTLTARYGTDKVHRRHFTVTVETREGKKSTDVYFGSPGQKPKVLR